MQDAAVAVGSRVFTGRIDADDGVELDLVAVLLGGRDVRSRGDAFVELLDALDVEHPVPVRPNDWRIAGRELQRDDAHADEVGAVDALERLGDDRLDAPAPVPLAASRANCLSRTPCRRGTTSGIPAFW